MIAVMTLIKKRQKPHAFLLFCMKTIHCYTIEFELEESDTKDLVANYKSDFLDNWPYQAF